MHSSVEQKEIYLQQATYSDRHQDFLDHNKGPLTQYGFYMDWQRSIGKTVHLYTMEDTNGNILLLAHAIEVPIGFGKKFLYCPYGPVVTEALHAPDRTEYRIRVLQQFATDIKQELRAQSCAFMRLDIEPRLEISMEPLVDIYRIAPQSSNQGSVFQPKTEWGLDLRESIESIHEHIDSKNRYAIRLAERKQVHVEIVTENLAQYFESLFQLLSETANRNNFGLHNKTYYEAIIKSIDENKNGRAIIARINGEVASIMIFVDYNKTTMFLIGASHTDLNRTVPTSHLAHWQNIQYTKNIGLHTYNFGGISNPQKPTPGLESLTRFKIRFGGNMIDHGHSYDIVSDVSGYYLFLFKKLLRFAKNWF